MKKYIITGILFLMIVSGGLLLISQRSNDSIENCMIEDYSNFDISVSESENTLDSSLKTTDEEKAAKRQFQWHIKISVLAQMR